MISCEQARPLLYALVDRELSEDQARQARTHLASCVHCKKLYASLRVENAHLRAALAIPVVEETEVDLLEHRLLQHIVAKRPATSRQRATSVFYLPSLLVGAVGLAFAVMVFLGIDTQKLYDQITRSLASQERLTSIVLDLAVMGLVAVIIDFQNELGQLFDKLKKGGLSSCL